MVLSIERVYHKYELVYPASITVSAASLSLSAVIKGSDFKTGVARAVPGWENVRLLAPHAELRLLACGQSSLIDAQRLRCLTHCLHVVENEGIQAHPVTLQCLMQHSQPR